MKRLSLLIIIVAVLTTLFACEGFLDEPPTPIEQVQGFLSAASAEPQVPATMQAYFHPDTGQRDLMTDPTYWDSTFFNDQDGPYTIVDPQQQGENGTYPGSVTVVGNVTNTFSEIDGYSAEFVLLPRSPDSFLPEYLIREITLGTGDEPIRKIGQ